MAGAVGLSFPILEVVGDPAPRRGLQSDALNDLLRRRYHRVGRKGLLVVGVTQQVGHVLPAEVVQGEPQPLTRHPLHLLQVEIARLGQEPGRGRAEGGEIHADPPPAKLEVPGGVQLQRRRVNLPEDREEDRIEAGEDPVLLAPDEEADYAVPLPGEDRLASSEGERFLLDPEVGASLQRIELLPESAGPGLHELVDEEVEEVKDPDLLFPRRPLQSLAGDPDRLESAEVAVALLDLVKVGFGFEPRSEKVFLPVDRLEVGFAPLAQGLERPRGRFPPHSARFLWSSSAIRKIRSTCRSSSIKVGYTASAAPATFSAFRETARAMVTG